ncbi:MAG TPA: YihY/virulence factor BrkB family protein [Ignavibacteriaceae bacterium]|nr:YihY/virulence factor BrkB family protein [Ignavibacteriaceae bacterium]
MIRIHPKIIWQLTRQTGKEWGSHKPLFVGAGISFYIIFSLGPILTLLVLLVGTFMGKANTIQEVVSQMQKIMGQKPAQLIQQIVQKASNSSTNFTTILSSIPLLFFGSTMIFYQIRNALNTIWDIDAEKKKGFINKIKKYGFSFLMLSIVGLIFLALVLKNPIMQNIQSQINYIISIPPFLITLADYVISFLLLTFLFAMIYKVLPEADISWSDVWVGAFVTAFLFLIVQIIVAFNAKNSNIESAFGSIGVFTILYLWIFYSSLIFLFGAEFTKIYAKKYGTFKEEE